MKYLLATKDKHLLKNITYKEIQLSIDENQSQNVKPLMTVKEMTMAAILLLKKKLQILPGKLL